MCGEREKLLGYVYGEVDPDERRQVQLHLDGCPECRQEVAAIGRVRQDLLAWDVPKHEPIWRPLPPPVGRPVWSQLPAWALAAAASLVLLAGAAGGVAVRLMTPGAAAPVVAQLPLAPVATEVVDQAALEARILERVRQEVRREFAASLAAVGPGTARSAVDARRPQVAEGPTVDVLSRRLAELEAWRDDQIGLNYAFDNRLGGLNQRTTRLGTQFSLLQRVAYSEPR